MLSINYSVLFVGFLRITSGLVEQRQPSLAVAVSRAGLQFFNNIGHKIVDRVMPKIVFPNISLPINDGPGEGMVYVQKLQLRKFQSPLFQFHLNSPNSINWESDGGAIKLSGNWHADYSWIAKFHLHGWVDVLASGIRSNLTLTAFGQDGHPQIQVRGCNVDILQLQLSLGGGVIQWIINLFKANLSFAVKQTIHEQLCNALQTVILNEANDALRTIPKHVNISSKVYLNYELEQRPIQVTSDHIIGKTYVDVLYGNRTCNLPTKSLQLGRVDDSFMSNIWISDVVPNCLLDSAHKSNYLNFMLNRQIFSKLEQFLVTSCNWYQICIGKFFPILAQRYPSRYIQMHFHSASAPTIRLSDKTGVTAKTNFFIDWQIEPETGKPDVNETLARIDMKLAATVIPIIFNQRLCGKVNTTQIHFTEIYSKIGKVSNSFFEMLEMILSPVITVAADTTLRLGIPIPLVENISLTNRTNLDVENGAVRCNVDFHYVEPHNPSSVYTSN